MKESQKKEISGNSQELVSELRLIPFKLATERAGITNDWDFWELIAINTKFLPFFTDFCGTNFDSCIKAMDVDCSIKKGKLI